MMVVRKLPGTASASRQTDGEQPLRPPGIKPDQFSAALRGMPAGSTGMSDYSGNYRKLTDDSKRENMMSKPTHTRIRMFNTKETYPNQSLNNDLCQAVRAGNTVYVRGQVGTDFEGNLVGLGDARAQAEQAMKNVKQLLEEAGSDLSHIVKTTTYLIDPRYREPVYQEVGKWLKGVFPISTGLVVSALGQPQWLMEIDVIAVIPDDQLPE